MAGLVGQGAGMRVVRVDRPMAERAVLTGERIVVLAAVESTLAPTESLLAQASMADAVDRVRVAVPVLSSPRLAVEAVADMSSVHLRSDSR